MQTTTNTVQNTNNNFQGFDFGGINNANTQSNTNNNNQDNNQNNNQKTNQHIQNIDSNKKNNSHHLNTFHNYHFHLFPHNALHQLEGSWQRS